MAWNLPWLRPHRGGRRPPPQLSYMETPPARDPQDPENRQHRTMELRRRFEERQELKGQPLQDQNMAAGKPRIRIGSELELTREERRDMQRANSMRPAFADPLCIPLLQEQVRSTEGVCTECVHDVTHVRISEACETHGNQISALFECIISDKAWLARMLQTGHRFVLLGPSDDLFEIARRASEQQEVLPKQFLRQMISKTRLTLLCMDGKGRCVPLDQQTLDANTIMGISGCSLHPSGVSTGRLEMVRKTMQEEESDNVKPVLRRLSIVLDYVDFDQDSEITRGMAWHNVRSKLDAKQPWHLALSLPLSFEDLREPIWMEPASFLSWLKWDSNYSDSHGEEAKRKIRDWDTWDNLGDRQLETAYLMLEQDGSSVGTALAQSQWDWGGTEGDCMVVSTTVTKQQKALPGWSEPKEVSTRNLFFHLQGIPIT